MRKETIQAGIGISVFSCIAVVFIGMVFIMTLLMGASSMNTGDKNILESDKIRCEATTNCNPQLIQDRIDSLENKIHNEHVENYNRMWKVGLAILPFTTYIIFVIVRLDL